MGDIRRDDRSGLGRAGLGVRAPGRSAARARLRCMLILLPIASLAALASATGADAPEGLAEPAERAFFQTRAAEQRFDATLRQRIEAELAAADTLPIPREPRLPADVKDGVFGYLIGLLDGERQGLVTGRHVQEVLAHARRTSRVPAELITEVVRVAAEVPGESWVAIRFTDPLDVAVPYSILGYHPGSLVSSAEVLAREWHVERLQVPDPRGPGRPALVIEHAALWAVLSGKIEIDIDGWVDALLGSRLDDTRVVGLAVFSYQGRRCAMALGYSRDGKPRSGVLDLAGDEILFPTPEDLKAIARHLRSRIVQRLSRFDLPVILPE